MVAGHHAGLANGTGAGERASLEDRLALSFGAQLRPLADAWREEITLPKPTFRSLDLHPNGKVAEKRNGFRIAFFVRMLFSCLVDADFLDTEAWYAGVEDRPVRRGEGPAIAALKAALDHHLAEKLARATPSDVNSLRAEVLRAARTAAERRPGLFSLTVPTGGGRLVPVGLGRSPRGSVD